MIGHFAPSLHKPRPKIGDKIEFRDRTFIYDGRAYVKQMTKSEKEEAKKNFEAMITPYKKTCLHPQSKEVMDDNGDIHEVCINCNKTVDWLPDELEQI